LFPTAEPSVTPAPAIRFQRVLSKLKPFVGIYTLEVSSEKTLPILPAAVLGAAREDWASAYRARIGELAKLRDGWNGREAPAPSERAAKLARKTLDRAERMGFKPERIVASAEGGIAVYFMSPDLRRYAYAECYNGGAVIAAMSTRDRRDSDVWKAESTKAGIDEVLTRFRQHLGG
jgi:hypothetical protein